jgi:hypothetical protein
MPIHLVKTKRECGNTSLAFFSFPSFLLGDTSTIYPISFAQVQMSQFIKLGKMEIKL